MNKCFLIAALAFLTGCCDCEKPQDPTAPTVPPIEIPEEPKPQEPLPSGPEENTKATHEIGPAKQFETIASAKIEDLAAGDHVKIYWKSMPYFEKILIRSQGTEAKPIIIEGIAGPNGELPIIDGLNATTGPGQDYRVVGASQRGLIHVGVGRRDPWGYKPKHIVIKNLHIRNAFHENQFRHHDGQLYSYTPHAAGIFVERGENIAIDNCIIESNGNGFFVASGDSEEVLSRNIKVTNSHLFNNGTVTTGFDRHHNVYTEAVGVEFKNNFIGPLRMGAGGSAFKDRSTGLIFEGNTVLEGARTLDLVEPEDTFPLINAMPDNVKYTIVRGNVFKAAPGPWAMFHFGGDHGLPERYRKGGLVFEGNEVLVKADQSEKWRTIIFDVSSNNETVIAKGNRFTVKSETAGAMATRVSWMNTAGRFILESNTVNGKIEESRDGLPFTGTIEKR